MRTIRYLFGVVLNSAVAFSLAGVAEAEQYPARSVRLLVPFAPGGALDFVGRIIGPKLTEALGQTVVVDNRGGAGGTLGADIVAKAKPDGYTILIGSTGLAVNAALYPKLPYDTLTDLAPVTVVGEQPNIVVTHPALPVKSLDELLSLARSRPGQVSYASGGVGSTSHLVTVLFLLMAKIDMLHVPYKGLGPAITDLVGGQVNLAIANVATALPHVKSGRLRLIAVTTEKRFPLFPETPTVDEAGVPGYQSSGWYGLLVPAGTPKAIIALLNEEMKTISSSAAIKDQFGARGMQPLYMTPDAFGKLLRIEIKKWAEVIRASGVKSE